MERTLRLVLHPALHVLQSNTLRLLQLLALMLVMVTKELVINVDKKNVLLELRERMVSVHLAQHQLIKMKLVKQAAKIVQLVPRAVPLA